MIGKGSYGCVVLCKNESNYYANKMIKNTKKTLVTDKKYLLNEILILLLNKSKYLLKLQDVRLEKDQLNIIMEYADKGDLSRIIKNRIVISPKTISKWILQVASGLEYLHNSGIIHRDVKAENIFLFSDKSVKLGDYGIVRVNQYNNLKNVTYIGTPYYMTPEIENGICNDKTDVWSLGCVLYELLHFIPPFNGNNLQQLIHNKKTKRIQFKCNKDFVPLLVSMLSINSNNRCTIQNLLENKVLHTYYPEHTREFCEKMDFQKYMFLHKVSWKMIVNTINEMKNPLPKPLPKQLPPLPKPLPPMPKPMPVPRTKLPPLPVVQRRPTPNKARPLLVKEYEKIFKSNIVF